MVSFKINTDDIFISYCRSDAKTYADGLANELTKKGFSCFTDALGSDSSEKIPDSLIKKLKNCMMLVIVGSKDASCSEAVTEEIEIYSSHKGSSSIIPIDFDNSISTANWQRFIIGLRREEERQEALLTGNPTPSIVSRIEKAFAYRKSKDRLKLYTKTAAIILSVLLLGILGASFIANRQFQNAQLATSLADSAKLLAKRQADTTRMQSAKASEATRLAKISDSSAAEALKKKNVADEQFKLASEKALAAKAMAQMQEKIATSFQYANESQALLLEPKLITASVNKAIRSTELSRSAGKYSAASDAALRTSINFLADLKSRRTYPYQRLFFDAGGQIIEEKSSESRKQYYRIGESVPFFELPCDGSIYCQTYSSVSVSKDCHYIAFGVERALIVFNTSDTTHKRLKFEKKSEYSISQIALSPNGKYLVVVTHIDAHVDGISVWDIARDTMIEMQTSGTTTVNSISFSINGTSLVLGCTDINEEGNFIQVAYVWNVDFNQDEIFDDYHISHPVVVKEENIGWGVAAGSDNEYFATYDDSVSIVWKQELGNKYRPMSYIITRKIVSDMAFKPGSEELMLIESTNQNNEEVGDYTVETWDYGGYMERNHCFLNYEVKEMVYEDHSGNLIGSKQSPDEMENGLIYWSNMKDSGRDHIPVSLQSDAIQYLSDDYETIVTFLDSLKIWNHSILENTIHIDTNLLPIENLTITPDRQWISWFQIAENNQRRVIVMTLKNGKYEKVSTFPFESAISTMCFSPDGSLLYLIDKNQSLSIWNSINQRIYVTTPFLKVPGIIQSFKLSPKGNYLSAVYALKNKYTEEKEYILSIWSLKNQRRITSIKEIASPNLYEWSPDEKHVLVGCIGNYTLFNIANCKQTNIKSISSDVEPSDSVFSFSPSGKYFGVVDKRTVRVFQTDLGEEVSRLILKGDVRSLAFRSDDHYITTVTENKSFFSINEEKTTELATWQFLPDDLIKEARRRLNNISERSNFRN